MAMRFTWVGRHNCWTIFLESVCWIIRRRIAQLSTGDCNVSFKNAKSNRLLWLRETVSVCRAKVTAQVLFPPRSFSSPVADDQAYVIRCWSGRQRPSCSCRMLAIKTEQALLARHSDLRSDVVIKGQHHSGESGSEAFLDAASPRLIIASSRDFPDHERISDTWAGNCRTVALNSSARTRPAR